MDGIYLLRIIEKLLIIYFTFYFLIDLLLFIYALLVFRKKRQRNEQDYNYINYPVSIVVPAYNEEVSVIDCIQMLQRVDYPDFEIIVVNDGSSDRTKEVLLNAYDFKEIPLKKEASLITRSINAIYKTRENLVFIDKQNGGKADAINAGINYSNKDFICTIDADSILDLSALKSVVEPFITKPGTLVSGGQLAVANEVEIRGSHVISSKVPKNIWVHWQIMEYIKSFMISRMGLSRIKALLIMSGAFSLFRKNDLLEAGGFLTPFNQHPYVLKNLGQGKRTVCEDMEIVVRLWRLAYEKKRKASATFLPQPVCWTEVPDNPKNLFKQRARWHQGLAETLSIHKKLLFEPAYRSIGLLALPYYYLFELQAPLIKSFTILFLIASAFYSTLNIGWIALLIVSTTIITAIFLSGITAAIENWSIRQYSANREALRYKSFSDWLKLIFSGIAGEFSYSFFKIAAQLKGYSDFLRKKSDWNKFERKGIKS